MIHLCQSMSSAFLRTGFRCGLLFGRRGRSFILTKASTIKGSSSSGTLSVTNSTSVSLAEKFLLSMMVGLSHLHSPSEGFGKAHHLSMVNTKETGRTQPHQNEVESACCCLVLNTCQIFQRTTQAKLFNPDKDRRKNEMRSKKAKNQKTVFIPSLPAAA
jgi:hypothetical protein